MHCDDDNGRCFRFCAVRAIIGIVQEGVPYTTLLRGDRAVDSIEIRTMQAPDLDFAAACTAAEGWLTQTRQVFEGFHAYDPEGCLVATADGMRIGICVATGYGAYGFIGELIVLPKARGRGVGRRLLEHAIAYLRAQGARSILLDGVGRAVPLYERVGFHTVCRSLRFSGTLEGTSRPAVRPMQRADLPALCTLDREAFGADRAFHLERRLSEHPALCKVHAYGDEIRGFIVGQRGGGMVSVGPWVAGPAVECPADLLESLALEAGGLPIGLGVLESNAQAAAVVRALGLAERPDPPWRMVLGPAAGLGASPLAYAIGSPATG